MIDGCELIAHGDSASSLSVHLAFMATSLSESESFWISAARFHSAPYLGLRAQATREAIMDRGIRCSRSNETLAAV